MVFVRLALNTSVHIDALQSAGHERNRLSSIAAPPCGTSS